MSLNLNSCPALVLNADYQPLSYFPLSTWSWKDALKAVFLNRVNVVSEYSQVVRSPSIEFKLPSVVSLKDYIPMPEKVAFTRFNVFLRDKFICQYCSKSFKVEDLTFDHVTPRSKGGKTIWENVVTSCRKCNTQKGNRSLKKMGIQLLNSPTYQTVMNSKKLEECFHLTFFTKVGTTFYTGIQN